MGLEEKLKTDAETVGKLGRNVEIYKECLSQLRGNHLFGVQLDEGKLITNDKRYYSVLAPEDVYQLESFLEALLLKKLDIVTEHVAALEEKYR